MGEVASQITSPAIVYSTVYSDADQRNHQSSVSLAFVRGIRRWPVNFPHKWPVTWKMFPFDDVPMVNTHKIVVLSQESMIRPLSCVGHVFFPKWHNLLRQCFTILPSLCWTPALTKERKRPSSTQAKFMFSEWTFVARNFCDCML